MTFVSTEGKCKSEDERKVNAKIADERKAAQNAKAVLDCLIPSNARTNRIIFVLRNAANPARTATLTRLEKKSARCYADRSRNFAQPNMQLVGPRRAHARSHQPSGRGSYSLAERAASTKN